MRPPTDAELALQVTYSTVCATAWILWDTGIHFDVEIECIWQRPTSWVKWAYAFIRYAPILHGGALLTLNSNAQFSASGCRGWIYEQLIFEELLTITVECVLVVRLYVLYNQNKYILWAIILAFIAEVAVMVVSLPIVLPKMSFGPDCLVTSVPGFFAAPWLSSLAFETFLFILTLVKFCQNITRRQSSILFIFIRDGTWAFALIFATMLLNMLMYKLSDTPLVGVGYGWAFAVMSFAGSHILINLRRLVMPRYPSLPTLTAPAFYDRSHCPDTRATSVSDINPSVALSDPPFELLRLSNDNDNDENFHPATLPPLDVLQYEPV